MKKDKNYKQILIIKTNKNEFDSEIRKLISEGYEKICITSVRFDVITRKTYFSQILEKCHIGSPKSGELTSA